MYYYFPDLIPKHLKVTILVQYRLGIVAMTWYSVLVIWKKIRSANERNR